MSDEVQQAQQRQQRQQMRRLLPAQASRPSAESHQKHTRQLVAAACTACRKNKAKCWGERPVCHRCERLHIECVYTTKPGERVSRSVNRKYNDLQTRTKALEEMVDLLKKLPDREAQDLFARIRSHDDIETILSHVKTGDALLQMAVSPETRFRYELPYRPEIPQDQIPNNLYLNSLIYEGASLYSPGSSLSRHNLSTTGNSANLRSEEYHNLYLKPFHAAHLVDARLSEVKISTWTNVCDDDVLMRDLLSGFLLCEYQMTAAFHKDLFLEDLAASRGDFCSPLLVNIILGHCCVCDPRFSNRAEYWNPKTLLYRFVAEAKRLWELEATTPRVTTVQAGILFNYFYNLCGLDEIGQAYRIQAIVLAHELCLFDSAFDDGGSARYRNGKAFTAWTLYNWETLVGFSFVFPPVLQKPPDWQLPDPSEAPEWYGEYWVKYPLTQYLLPLSFGHVFKAKCEFRVIMNEFSQAAYSKGPNLDLQRANEFLSRLRTWFNDLPGPLLPKMIVLPGHLQLHMYYHHIILTIYQPLLEENTHHEPSPHQIVADAKKHLQTLVRLYYLRHGFEAADLFIVIPLMLLASDCVEEIGEQTPLPELETLRSTLILATQGLYKQRQNFYLAEALFRVIRGRMRPVEVALLKGTVTDLHGEEDDTDDKRAMVQAVRSHWPVSVIKKEEDLDSHILKNLVENYAHLNVDGEGPEEEETEEGKDVNEEVEVEVEAVPSTAYWAQRRTKNRATTGAAGHTNLVQ